MEKQEHGTEIEKRHRRPERRGPLVRAARAAALASVLLSPSSALSQERTQNTSLAMHHVETKKSPQLQMRVYGEENPPPAFLGFCERIKSACATYEDTPSKLMERRPTTKEDMDTLSLVNAEVNQRVHPKFDSEQHGESDYWEEKEIYPEDSNAPPVYGDCEDYVLIKRKILIEQHGWAPSQLLVTVVIYKNEGHAILTARTDRGDFVLDNQLPVVLLWTEAFEKMGYEAISRQSYLNPKVFVSLRPRQ